jgi:hypothetical protein
VTPTTGARGFNALANRNERAKYAGYAAEVVVGRGFLAPGLIVENP